MHFVDGGVRCAIGRLTRDERERPRLPEVVTHLSLLALLSQRSRCSPAPARHRLPGSELSSYSTSAARGRSSTIRRLHGYARHTVDSVRIAVPRHGRTSMLRPHRGQFGCPQRTLASTCMLVLIGPPTGRVEAFDRSGRRGNASRVSEPENQSPPRSEASEHLSYHCYPPRARWPNRDELPRDQAPACPDRQRAQGPPGARRSDRRRARTRGDRARDRRRGRRPSDRQRATRRCARRTRRELRARPRR